MTFLHQYWFFRELTNLRKLHLEFNELKSVGWRCVPRVSTSLTHLYTSPTTNSLLYRINGNQSVQEVSTTSSHLYLYGKQNHKAAEGSVPGIDKFEETWYLSYNPIADLSDWVLLCKGLRNLKELVFVLYRHWDTSWRRFQWCYGESGPRAALDLDHRSKISESSEKNTFRGLRRLKTLDLSRKQYCRR